MVKPDVRLLVVDDDDINVFIIQKIVEKTGFTVEMTSKSNGELALEYLNLLLENNTPFPDLILVDINMPVFNGWEFIEAYEGLQTPFSSTMYMLSSSVYENDIEKARNYESIKGFISKPLTIERLKELFENLNA